MKTGMSVLDAMTKSPVTVFDHATVEECAKIMKKEGLGSLVIMDKGKINGIITQEDIVFKVTAERLKLETPVKEIMSTKLITVTPDTDIYDALILLKEHGIKQLPVVHENKLVGISSVKDILDIEPELFNLWSEQEKIR
ncbi:CBS domain-containing protein [archaeon]|nr:CBS domain-containing protein [archaeon]